MEKNIWVNITTSCKYGKTKVGIVRSEVEIAKQLFNLDPERIRFCVYRGGQFTDLTPHVVSYYKSHKDEKWFDCFLDEISISQKEQKHVTTSAENITSYCLPILPRRTAMKALAQALLSLCPVVFRGTFNRVLLWGRDSIYQRLLSLKSQKMLNGKLRKQFTATETSLRATQRKGKTLFKHGDIFFSMGLDWDYPYFQEYSKMKKEGVKIVTYCHDVVPILYPQYCLQHVAKIFPTFWVKCAEFSDLILSNSTSSVNSLVSFLSDSGARVPKIVNAQLGDWHNVVPQGEPVSAKVMQLLNQKFVLYVSTVERRKNHDLIYKVCHDLMQSHDEDTVPTFVFVGRKGWGVEATLCDIKLDPKTRNKIVVLGSVNDTELDVLYRNCLFTVFPSVFEGWGMPVRESLAYGKFALVSNAGALPEAAEGFCELLHPWDVLLWKERIMYYVNNLDHLEEKQKFIRFNFQPYSWKMSASFMYNQLREL